MFRDFPKENTIEDETNCSPFSQPKYPFLEAISDVISPPALELKPVTVNYVNRSLEGQYGLSLHGYVTVGGRLPSIKLPLKALTEKKIKLKEQHGVVFYIGGSRDHTPYYVSDALLKEVENTPSFSEKIKQVVKKLQGKHYPTTENFLQDVIFNIVEQDQIDISDEKRQKLHLLAMNPYYYEVFTKELNLDPENNNELKNLLRLNRRLNDFGSAILPYSVHSDFSLDDTEAFEKKECYILEYPSINPTHIYDLFQQQQLFQRYMEDRLNMGESVDKDEKKSEPTVKPDINRIKNRLVSFYTHTLFENPFYANCNKATATLLQEAEYLSAKEQKREPAAIVGASNLSFGSNQRMFFWNSRLQQTIADLFINREIKPDDAGVKLQLELLKNNPKLFQELVDKKYYIMKIIETWPIDQERRALNQILDKSTPLGTVFAASRSGMYRQPDPSRGALSLAQQRLKNLTEEIENNKTMKTFSQ